MFKESIEYVQEAYVNWVNTVKDNVLITKKSGY